MRIEVLSIVKKQALTLEQLEEIIAPEDPELLGFRTKRRKEC
jgi:hypothetical protein